MRQATTGQRQPVLSFAGGSSAFQELVTLASPNPGPPGILNSGFDVLSGNRFVIGKQAWNLNSSRAAILSDIDRCRAGHPA